MSLYIHYYFMKIFEVNIHKVSLQICSFYPFSNFNSLGSSL